MVLCRAAALTGYCGVVVRKAVLNSCDVQLVKVFLATTFFSRAGMSLETVLVMSDMMYGAWCFCKRVGRSLEGGDGALKSIR